MKPIFKRFLIGVGILAALAVLAFVALVIRLMMPPLSSFARANEKLPAVIIENGNTVYCRMKSCDFRFPLPDKSHVVWTNIDDGGFDTIHGSIHVIGTDGGPINLQKYAEFLRDKNWDVNVASGFGCPDVTNNMKDIPFVTPKGVTHFPLFEDFGATSSKDEGGVIDAQTENGITKIRFSYFGDM
jgi:hypothetical protein